MNRRGALRLGLVFFWPVGLLARSGWDLREREVVKRLRGEAIPEAERGLRSVTGSPVRIDVDWETFGDLRALEHLADRTLQTLVAGFRQVAVSDFNRDALASGVQTIRLRNVRVSRWGDTGGLTEGVLAIDWDFNGPAFFTPTMVANKLLPQL